MRCKHARNALVALLTLSAAFTGQAFGQCILANPSFELGGSGGAVFGGWNQFGVVGTVATATHGSKAARLSGPSSGDWDTSGFWQTQDCEPDEQWEATGHVQHPADKPLTGESTAIVYVEWRDTAGEVIDYESFTVADASSPTGSYIDFSVVSSPAPAGTAVTVFVLGILQSPGDPSPDVYFDQVTYYSTTPPTIDDLQWNDFPGGRTITFGDHVWRVKGPGYFGPGPNVFDHLPNAVWVDAQNQLHLTLQNTSGTWKSTEVTTAEALGYGDYILTTVGRLDLVDPQAVLGIFLWEYGPCWDYGYTWWNAFNEIDIEYSRWGNPSNDIAQFVAQPYDYPGNISRFDATFGDEEVTSHAMRWLADRIEYRVWRGGPEDESPDTMIHSWSYAGPHIPRPEQPRLHLNLWKLGGTPAANQEVVFQDFTFVPEGGVSAVVDGSQDALPGAPDGRLFPAAPNPFNPQTTVRFALLADGSTELDVYDLKGRRVRTLVSGYLTAGEHQAVWDGRNDEGRVLGSGVYLVRLRGSDYMETQRLTLLK